MCAGTIRISMVIRCGSPQEAGRCRHVHGDSIEDMPKITCDTVDDVCEAGAGVVRDGAVGRDVCDSPPVDIFGFRDPDDRTDKGRQIPARERR